MSSFFAACNQSLRDFAKEEDGAQVVEYALIIALVSIVLAALLGDKTNGLGSAFASLVTRVKTCLGGTGTCS
ncbi:MAG: Flp family type IVb pilin [Burkholderiaceae bacterium]